MGIKKIIIGLCLGIYTFCGCSNEPLQPIRSGEIWPDNNGEHINAHGGGVMYHDGTYYWFGENKCDTTSSAMVGVMCYSSRNLTDWKNEGVALSVVDNDSSDIARGCILERPKVIYNAKTGKFVMWFHLELKGKGYAAARAGVAVSDTPAGPYRFIRDVYKRQVRTNTLAERIKLNGDVEPAAPSNKVITGFDANIHTLLPIPLTEIQLNKDGDLKQNPGY